MIITFLWIQHILFSINVEKKTTSLLVLGAKVIPANMTTSHNSSS